MSWSKRVENEAAEQALKWLKQSDIAMVIDLAEVTTRFRQGNADRKNLDDEIVFALADYIDAALAVDPQSRVQTDEHIAVDRKHNQFCELVATRYMDQLNLDVNETKLLSDEGKADAAEARELFLQTHLEQTDFSPMLIPTANGRKYIHKSTNEVMEMHTYHAGYEVASRVTDTIDNAIMASHGR